MSLRLAVSAALTFWLLSSPAWSTGDPLQPIREQAETYAAELEQAGRGYTDSERQSLAAAAQVLTSRSQCGQALGLRKLVASASAQYRDWLALADDARCARSWEDAVNAAYQAAESAADPRRRQRALLRLAQALEGHWRYGAAEALVAYREAARLGTVGGIEERIARLETELAEQSGLRIDRDFTQTDAGAPAICLDFSEGMPEPENQRYGDYIRFEPDFPASFRLAAFDEVCAEGAEFGTDYRVRILPGLSGNDGGELAKALNREVSVGDRSPSLWFQNSLHVLPRGGGGVPLHSVNLEQAELALYRIDERNLQQEFVRNKFHADIDRWEAERLRDQLGEQVWSGRVELALRRNREALTQLPIADLIAPQPGVYVLTAAQPPAEGQNQPHQRAAQWLVVSDLGLTSYRGSEGLTLVARSLASAEPLAGVRLALYGRNNRLLAEAETGADGVARLPAASLAGRGGAAPSLVLAFGPGDDFNFLDLEASAFDLSDRGVGGRPTPGPLDAFVYAERGVYRPGDRVQLALLLRNDRGLAVDGLPLTLRLLRPDEQQAGEWLLHPQGAGGYQIELPISASAATGRWKALAYVDPKAAPVGQTAFLVEAIVPPRIEVELTEAPNQPLRPDTEADFAIQARYLFGAPAADLTAQAEVRVEPDPDPFPDYPGYRFGPVDEPSDSVLLPLEPERTDAEGRAGFSLSIDRLPKVRRPLRALLRAEVADVDGRAVAASRWVPVRHQPLALGIKAPGQGAELAAGTEAVFELLALDPAGRPLARSGLEYRLVEEEIHYQWYRDGSQWQYKRQRRDRLLREGEIALGAEAPGRVGLPLVAGRYRFELRDPETGLLSSARVRVGWQSAGADAETPDMLRLTSDQTDYAPGADARIHLQAPFAGRAELVLANDRVLSVRQIDHVETGSELNLEVDPDWGAGAYALVTVYRPDGGEAGRGPRRAVGVVWLGLRQDERRLAVAIQAPERSRPETTQEVALQVSGQAPGEAVFVTLAAVDDGVLQLTDYRTPDPLGHYFGQRRLGVGMRDLYGRLIDGRQGRLGRIRAGGGAGAGRQGMPESNIQVVSLFSGVLRLDAQGRAQVPLQLPAFDGRLRLTAVAWSAQRLGSARADLTVREPVVLLPSLPRFLAAGDRSRASLLIQNLEGPPGAYRLDWQTGGALAPAAESLTVELAQGQRQALSLPLQAQAVGLGSLALRLRGPDGWDLERRLRVGIRAPFIPETRRRYGRLEPGAEIELGPQLAAGLRSETLSGAVSLSADPALDVPGLLRQLDLYPYGCLEQVTSRAFPLLHFERLSERWGYASDAPVAERLDEAVTRILEKQLDNGGFALWNPNGAEEPWLSAHALEFLQRARAAGVAVPDFAWQRGLDWLRRQVEYPATEEPEAMAAQVYALYLLAREGEGHPETARYLLDELGDRLPGPLALDQLGSALALMGDRERARRALALADAAEREAGLRDYGSDLRDQAARVLLRSELPELDPELADAALADRVQRLAEALADDQWLSTQEQAWLVRAADALSGSGAELALSLDASPLPDRPGPLVLRPGGGVLESGLRLGNRGNEAVWYSAAVIGSPIEEPPPLASGFRIQRRLFDLQGRPLDPQALSQGQMMLVLLEGQAETDGLTHQALIVDPLAAGLEVESPNLAQSRSAADLSWLGELSQPMYSDALDDRFVAALDLGGDERGFRLAYLARAVNPGSYRLPPPEVEDMYKPRYRGRGQAGWLQVAPAP